MSESDREFIDEDWMDYDHHDEIAHNMRHRRRTFSIEARGEAVHHIFRAKKRPGFPGRGAFVSKCVAFYMREHPFENTRGRIAYLEKREEQLLRSIEGLQSVIRELLAKNE